MPGVAGSGNVCIGVAHERNRGEKGFRCQRRQYRYLLSREFLLLVLVSFLIAAPLAGYFMHQWLEAFAYKIDMSWWIFGIAGMSALVIEFITISVHAIQSAIVNPVKSLKAD